MQRILEGQVAIVTGASNGLGAATARLLGRAGATVVATARSKDKLDTLTRIMQADGVPAVGVAADLSKDEDVANLTQTALAEFGQIDIVMNVGGTADGIGKNLWEVTPEDWADIQAANTDGPFFLIRHILPHMLERQTGRMAFLSSSATVRPVGKTGAYTASKMAVNGMVHTLPLEIGNAPVAFNAFNPGPIDTKTYSNVTTSLNQPGQMRDAGQPPEEAAVLPLWLCSQDTYGVTGEFLHWRDPEVYRAVREFAARMNLILRS